MWVVKLNSREEKPMDEQIEQSRHYVFSNTGWTIDESTFQVLDANLGLWIARVTTTHLAAGGMPDLSFTVIAKGSEHMVISDKALPVLNHWLVKSLADGNCLSD
jgi:hypothetical protein